MTCVLTPISVNGGPVSGSLSAGCSSTHRAAYAKFWTFTVVQGANNVVIQMTGSGFTDTYLYLLQGIGFTGPVLYEDDDSGPGFQALIQIPYLPPGSYTIETTSFAAGKVGAFTLEIAGVVIPPVVHPPVLVFEHLTLTEQQKAFFPNVHNFAESLTITDGATGIRGAPPVVLPEVLTITEALVTAGGTFAVPISESLAITEMQDATMEGEVMPLESLAVSEVVVAENVVAIGESLTITDAMVPAATFFEALSESLSVAETVELAAIYVESLDDTTLRLTFPTEIQLSDALDLLRYHIQPTNGGVPVLIERVLPIQRAKLKGVEGDVGSVSPSTSVGPGVNLGESLAIHEMLAVEHRRDIQFYGESEPPTIPLIVDTINLKDMASFDAVVGD